MEALRTLELIHKAGVVKDGEVHAVHFSDEILKLKAALRVVGVEDDDSGQARRLY